MLAPVDYSCLNQLLRYLPNGDFSASIIFLHVLVQFYCNGKPSLPHFYLLVHLFIAVWIHGLSCIIQWVIIHYYCYIFSHSDCPWVGQWESFLSFDMSSSCIEHFLEQDAQAQFVRSPPCNQPSLPGSWMFFVEKEIEKLRSGHQIVGTRSIVNSRSSHRGELGSIPDFKTYRYFPF